MKIAYSNLACPEWSIEEVFEYGREFGFDGVEIRLIDGQVIPAELDESICQRLTKASNRTGLEVIGLGASTKFATEDADLRQQNVEALLKYIELAARLEVPMIRTFGGGIANPPLPQEQAVHYVAASLAQVSRRAEELGVSVLLETHDDFSHSHMVRDVVAEVNSTAIGALWDTHHPVRMGETINHTVQNLGPGLKHVHLKDARRDGDQWELVPFGEGDVPVERIVRTLIDAHYDRYLCVEWEKKWHPEIEAAKTALPKHMQRLKAYIADAKIEGGTH